MKTMKRAIFVLGVLAFMAACGRQEAEWVVVPLPGDAAGDTTRVVGVIRHIELEGGFYAIQGSDSVNYDPTNLPDDFKEDGLAVEADVRLRPDMGGFHMSGPIVDVIRIRKR